MKVFLIRHKESGDFMPEYKSGKGYSYWRRDEIFDNQKKTPRLLESRKQAEKVIVEWSKGALVWEEVPRNRPNMPLEGWNADLWKDERQVLRNLGRTKDMLEVVEMELKEIV